MDHDLLAVLGLYVAPGLAFGWMSWRQARTRRVPPWAGLLFAALPFINLVCACFWLGLCAWRAVDSRLRRFIGEATPAQQAAAEASRQP